MPISIRFLFFARPLFDAIKLIRVQPGVRSHHPHPLDAQHTLLVQELSKRLPPHLKRDLMRDE